ncbi:hypothetical protein KY328_05970 [Candidatus Woesearchaeota archaeon]|nr:hypothetical protein [Candidatus Woesearchaeota archaeon]MBW3022447.1 hypothetical protein [Candidatus Woesearchaeota archaeon]
MLEKTLLKIALVITVIGIASLFLISEKLEINENIISIDNIGKDVKVTGLVTRISDTDNVMFLEISKPEKITACIFKNRFQSININESDIITVEGEIEEYEGKLELIVNRIIR